MQDFIYFYDSHQKEFEVMFDCAEGGCFWLDNHEEDTMDKFSFDEMRKVRDFLNYWFESIDKGKE